MMRLFCKFWIKFRVWWSNKINKDDVDDYELLEKHFMKSFTKSKLLSIQKDLYSRFNYKYDSFKELFDSMKKPAQCYVNSCEDNWEDDCDGFHAALYHILFKNGYRAKLLTMLFPENILLSHTVCIVEKYNKIILCDYTSQKVFSNIYEIISYYQDINNVSFVIWNIVSFDENKYIIENFR